MISGTFSAFARQAADIKVVVLPSLAMTILSKRSIDFCFLIFSAILSEDSVGLASLILSTPSGSESNIPLSLSPKAMITRLKINITIIILLGLIFRFIFSS